jgi:dsDNA-specific endonuclease/ATPase MutS2
MNPHSLRVLELDRVRDALSERASWAGGVRAVHRLAPADDPDGVARRLSLVSEVRRILATHRPAPLDEKTAQEVDRIVAAARRELTGD